MTLNKPSFQRFAAALVAIALSAQFAGCVGESIGAKPDATKGPPAGLSYSANPTNFTIGVPATPDTISYTGAQAREFKIEPSTLPDGLLFDETTGTVSGTPTALIPPTPFLITATNANGSSFMTLMVSVNDALPTISYGNPTTLSYTVGTPISDIIMNLAGGAATGCVSSPALPAGLLLTLASPTTCVLSGIPTAAAAQTSYLLSASNSGGQASISFDITVVDLQPAFSYAGGPYNYFQGFNITPLIPDSTGGVIVSCAAVPALPAGLTLSPSCVLSGKPTVLVGSASYAITATNSGGTATQNVTLQVTEKVPAISYSGSPFSYRNGSAIPAVNATNAGGAVSTCSSSPALPAGLSISGTTCAITGTPSAISPATDYTITASNSAGSGTATINITVTDSPPVIAYGGSPYTFVFNGSPIAPVTPTHTGGAITSCSASPGLPAGLTIDSSTCTLSGTPTASSSNATYAITASNSGGSSTVSIQIRVNDLSYVLPALSYSGGPFTFNKGTLITPVIPSNTGGTILNCSSTPPLPPGLTLDAHCNISGAPTFAVASTSYTVTASNNAGNSSAMISILVNDAAPAFSYPASPYNLTRGSTITTIVPASTGGTITGCTASPALPAGLSLSANCGISGTPSAISAAADFVITATNSGGSSSATVNLAVKDVAPAITYVGSPYVLTMGAVIADITPINTGGPPTACSPSPVLPAGLVLSSSCVISGTPSAITAAAGYAITATNTGGTSSFVISIAVNDATPTLSYSPTTFSYPKDAPIAAVLPTTGGGAIVSCSVSPTLPAGLTLSSGCALSGTPTQVRVGTDYTITSTNTGGSASAILNIAVTDVAPVISFAPGPYVYTKGTAIPSLSPTNTGGAVVSCAASPALPPGLSLSSACTISGIPVSPVAAGDYAITATNSGGSSSVLVNMRVNDIPPGISYSGSPFGFTEKTAIAPIDVSNTGGAVTACSSLPALPAGLTLSSNCSITGTPSAPAAGADYVITAQNSGGNASATIHVTVIAILPAISYSGSPYTFTNGLAITPKPVTNTGGAPVTCSSAPALPAGLSVANDCTISGTPTAVSATANYTVTAVNSAGANATTISVQVNDVAPTLSYPGGPFSYTLNTAISALAPANAGGAIVSCTVSPALPAGLSLSSGCVISGTPLALVAAAGYTITATNTGGSASATANIAIIDVAPNFDYIPTSYAFSYTRGVAITPVTANSNGGTLVSCAAAPPLPAGLSLSSGCNLSGTPTALKVATDFTITASNSGGTYSQVINISVTDAAPVISYAGSPWVFIRGTAITNKTPANTGGSIVSCSVSPALPAGLSLSSGCVISGTPGINALAADYIISATNSGGTGAAVVNITVQDNPPVLSYTGSPFTYPYNVAITPLNPNNSGGGIVSCTSNPALPAGLSLSSGCAISGTPSAVTSVASYVISATNSGGTSNATITITIANTKPAITYPGTPYIFVTDAAITPLSPTNSGGAIASCSSTPALPIGLSLSSTCDISGTPTVVSVPTNYSISATNTVGTGTFIISIRVNSPPPVLSYNPSSAVFVLRNTITPITPTLSGGTVSTCTASPTLPAGLAISATCVITGTPLVTSGATFRTITATNSGGSSSAALTITIKDQPEILFHSLTSLTGSFNGTAAAAKNIWKITVDGLGLAKMTNINVAGRDTVWPSFTADGSSMVYSTKQSGLVSFNIWKALGSTGASATALTTDNVAASQNDQPPSYSPDGTKVVFAAKLSGSSSYNIYIMSNTGTGKTALTANTNPGLDSLAPVFSSDGSMIYFQSMAALDGSTNGTGAGAYNIWKMSVNGTGQAWLTNETAAGKDNQQPAVSPDGTAVVYSSMGDTTGPVSSFNIWKINTDGSGKTYLTNNTVAGADSISPSFSPDGSEIAFSSKMDVNGATANSYNIWKMSVTGANQAALTKENLGLRDSYNPVFEPDSLRIAFYSFMNIGGTQALSSNIWVMNEDGTNLIYLTANTNSGLDSALSPNMRVWYQQ